MQLVSFILFSEKYSADSTVDRSRFGRPRLAGTQIWPSVACWLEISSGLGGGDPPRILPPNGRLGLLPGA